MNCSITEIRSCKFMYVLLILVNLIGCFFEIGNPPEAKLPNIIFIFADDLG